MNTIQNDNIPYEYRHAPILGGGFVTGFCFHPKYKNILYARTDIGGVYHYDFSIKTWISLMDHVKATHIWETYPLSMALDPIHPEWLYIVAGDNEEHNYLCRSKDSGSHFDYFKIPAKVHGNAPGRGTGERLMVDPCNSNILYYASQTEGLLISEDYGENFNKLSVKPEGGKAESNLAFICIDPRSLRNGRCQTIIVSTSGQENSPDGKVRGSSLYLSRDAGKTFHPLPGQPYEANFGNYPGFVGQRAAFCGNYLFITMAAVDKSTFGWTSYSCDTGGKEHGCILRYELSENGDVLDYSYVTPDLSFMGGSKDSISKITGFGGIDAHPSLPGHLICSTQCCSQEEAVLYTTDYGVHWFPILHNLAIGKIDFTEVPYMKPEYNNGQSLIHWLSDIKIDPFHPNRAIFNTGTGAFITENLMNGIEEKQVCWSPCCKGMEETVHLNVYSPPEGEVQMIDMVGDLGGFAFTDLTMPAENSFADSNHHRYITCMNADFVDANPKQVAATARGNWKGKTTGGIICSQDQCRTWTRLPDPMNISQKVEDLIKAIRRPNMNSGWVAVAADGITLVWCIADRNQLPVDAVVYTDDLGVSWSKSIVFDKERREYKKSGMMKVFSDRTDAEVFYGFGEDSDMFISTDRARSFYQIIVPDNFPKLPLGTIESNLRMEIRVQPKKAGVVWVSTGSGGLWKIAFHKQSKVADFTLITNKNDAVFCVGIGKAATGSVHDTLYINGIIDEEYGFYRSLDEGMTWQRINMEKQMYGDIRSVSGDPRIFGRVYIATGSRGMIWGEQTV